MELFGRKIKRKDMPRLAMLCSACVVVLIFLCTLLSTLYGIYDVRRDINDCKEAIAQKENELKQLEQKKAYYESDEFLEDAVRSGGYVGKDEIVFVITN